MKKQPQADPWSQLVSDLGLEGDASDQTPVVEDKTAVSQGFTDKVAPAKSVEFAEPIPIEQPVKCPRSEPAATETNIETDAEVNAEKGGEGKKTFFGRFPKINFFGNSSKDTLEAVVEGSKTPSLSGKSFTSKTLEKVPVSPKRDTAESKASKPAPATKRPERKETPTPPKPETPVAVDPSDPWSQIASQVGILSVTETRETIETTVVEKTSRDERGRGRGERGRGRKNLPSLFDDEPPAESEESRALKNLMENEPDSGDEAVKRLRSLFDDDNAGASESSKREPREEKRDSRRRGRWEEPRDDRREESERPAKVESSTPPPRRGRGSRYFRNEELAESTDDFAPARENTSEDEDRSSMWDADEEARPVERSSRGRRRRGNRAKDESRDDFERKDSNVSDEETSEVAQLHRNIPSWDEAIALIIDENVAKRNQRSSESRRGRR